MCDLELDIWVEPDRSWRWKDRDEYRELIERGLVTAAEAAAVEADAERWWRASSAADPPFDDSWSRLAARSGLVAAVALRLRAP